jgi:hypothetical protein
MANGKTVKRCVGGAVDERRRIHATNTGEFLGMAWRGGSPWAGIALIHVMLFVT